MSKARPVEQIDIQTKIKEAETCHSMGMSEEALSLYEQILSLSSDQDDQNLEAVRNKISHLRKEIEVQEMAENQGLSAEDITLFRKNLSLKRRLSSMKNYCSLILENPTTQSWIIPRPRL
jgi:cob(I)alamin adenosyltransferase